MRSFFLSSTKVRLLREILTVSNQSDTIHVCGQGSQEFAGRKTLTSDAFLTLLISESHGSWCVLLCLPPPLGLQNVCTSINICSFYKRNSEQKQSHLWNTMKNTDTHTMGVLGEKRDKVAEKICEELMSENIPNLMKDMNLHIKKLKESKQSKL